MAVTLDEISALMDQKLLILRVQITNDIEKKFQERIEKNSRNIAGNTATLEGHTQKFEQMKTQLDKTVEELQAALQKQTNELDDLANRSMRGNVVVKGLEESDNEDWTATKNMLCDYLASLSNEPAEEIFNKLDRAHRSGKMDRNKPRNIYANFLKSTDADYYVEQCIKHNVKHTSNPNRSTIKIDHQFSKRVMDRRNEAMIERRQLLNAKKIVKAHLVYPAKLMVKTDHKEKKWTFFKEF